MNIITIVIGIFLVLFAIPSYNLVPTFITTTMNKLTGGNGVSPMASQIFSQLGIPPVDVVTEYIQYSFIGCVFAGIGVIAYGIVQKRTKRSPVKVSIETNQDLKEEDANAKALQLLQERLAKGDITSSQYKNLRKLLED